MIRLKEDEATYVCDALKQTDLLQQTSASDSRLYRGHSRVLNEKQWKTVHLQQMDIFILYSMWFNIHLLHWDIYWYSQLKVHYLLLGNMFKEKDHSSNKLSA